MTHLPDITNAIPVSAEDILREVDNSILLPGASGAFNNSKWRNNR